MSTQSLESGLHNHKAQGSTPAAAGEHFLLGSSHIPCHGEGKGGGVSKEREDLAGCKRESKDLVP